ncbi:MAG TPA: gliding motility-associated C-terminal domain-containing protein [Cyclobacteriaceae bacterium]|nr:gliding motility-associated C-terminal domain-containing protein [Cyclobacteriaceae bacterium]
MARGSKLIVFILVIALSAVTRAYAQNLAKAEYFFDTDPGQGNGTNLPVTPGTSLNFTSNISVAALPAGFHILGLRVKQNGGIWSLFEARGFYISTASPNTTNISKAEYFIDTDPGQGNGTPITVSTGTNVNFAFSVPTTSLSAGFHFLSVRVRDISGHWSLFEARGFFITTSTTNVTNIAAAEYFYDADPGNGSGIPISVTPGPTVNFTVPLPVGGLTPGFHFLGVRVKALGGRWGIFEGRGFYVSGSTSNAAAIAGAEYFFDTDPGSGNGTSLTIPSGDVSNFNVNLPIAGLTPGFHFLTIRVKDSAGRWGQFESRGFYVYPGGLAAGDIDAAEYFIDTDPGQGLALPTTVTTPGLNINQVFPLLISGIPAGLHKLGFRVRDSEGVWSEPKISDITVLNCTPPPSPVAVSSSRCNAGTVKLTAAGALSGHEYKWYTEEFVGSPIFTGSELTTPVLSVTTDYYVSIYDPATTCESARVKATATVLIIAKPVINASGTVTLCEGTSFLLSAPDGFASYKWSDGSLTQQVLVTESGKYSVIINNGTCELPVSDEVTFNFLTRPGTPTITVTGTTNICNSGSVTLQGPTGADSYAWSNGATTESITVSATGSYQLTVGNVAGCKSASSVAVSINVYSTPATPVIAVTGLTALCTNGFIVLSAPSGFAHYEWSGGETTQTIIVKNAGTYSVKVADGPGCFSALSAAVSVTQTGQPCTSGPGGPVNPDNIPPEIEHAAITTAVRGKATLDLIPLISDHNGADDIVLTSLKITGPPSSGAKADIDGAGILTLDYSQTGFSGSEFLTIQVCDVSASCTQEDIDINVAGDITPFNALSPNGDGKNESLYLEFIEIIPDTKTNKVTIFNRWGSPVFEIADYNNNDRVFKGMDQSGKELPNGTYFYRVEFESGKKTKDGFITLRR